METVLSIRWPLWGLAGIVLIESRSGLISIPELSEAAKRQPTDAAVAALSDDQAGAFIGTGLTALGLACLIVYLLSLAQAVRREEHRTLAPGLIVVGGGIAAATMLMGQLFLFALGVAVAGDYATTTAAAIDSLASILAYTGYIAIGLVTAGATIAGIRDDTLPRWLGWFSAVVTAVFAMISFFPTIAWLPALIWFLVSALGLLLRPGPVFYERDHHMPM